MLTNVPRLKNIDSGNFFLIAGPCAIEGEDIAMEIAEKVSAICDRLQIPYILLKFLAKHIVKFKGERRSSVGSQKNVIFTQVFVTSFGYFFKGT